MQFGRDVLRTVHIGQLEAIALRQGPYFRIGAFQLRLCGRSQYFEIIFGDYTET